MPSIHPPTVLSIHSTLYQPPTLFAISSLPPPIIHCAALLRVVKQKLRPGYLLREKAELAMGGRFDGDVWGGGGLRTKRGGKVKGGGVRRLLLFGVFFTKVEVEWYGC